MAREYYGPARLPQEPAPSSQAKRGTLEHEDRPCGVCGKPLLQNYVDQRFVGDDDDTRFMSDTYCRNECEQPT